MSVVAGEAIHFHLSTHPRARYRIELFRLGWYHGLGGRRVACLPRCHGSEAGTAQPLPTAPTADRAVPVRAGWPVTDVALVGRHWLSGYYEARFLLTSGVQAGRGTQTYFIVRTPEKRRPRILVEVPVNTWQAYNTWGGRSLYLGPTGPGYRVSFDRPYGENKQSPREWELQLVHYLERGGYDVAYQTDLDTDSNPESLLRPRLVISAGHDEYWTKTIRDAFERARDAGVNLAFIGANDGFWQIRYENNRQTIVEYRSAQLDPEPDPALKTTVFRRLVPPRPECTLRGVSWTGGVGAIRDYTPVSSALSDPWFRHTGFTDRTVLPGLVGYEWDTLDTNCSVPHLTPLFHSTDAPNADAVRYVASSGAIVFSAGSLRFSWGLDAFRPRGESVPADPQLQRFMHNALHDLLRPNRAASSAGSGTSAAAISGQSAGVTYHYRLVATSDAGTTRGGRTLTTAGQPAVTTWSARGIGPTPATLDGSVDPNAQSGDWYFEDGTTTPPVPARRRATSAPARAPSPSRRTCQGTSR